MARVVSKAGESPLELLDRLRSHIEEAQKTIADLHLKDERIRSLEFECRRRQRTIDRLRSENSRLVDRDENGTKLAVDREHDEERDNAMAELGTVLGMELDDILTENNLACNVCYGITANKTKCNHTLCISCMRKLDKCPICRLIIR